LPQQFAATLSLSVIFGHLVADHEETSSDIDSRFSAIQSS
jgi:hypothetical protein